MEPLLRILPIFFLLSFSLFPQDDVRVLKAEAQIALEYLNQVRQNPASFSKSIGVNLDKVQATMALKLDPILQKVAEEKARDMAKRAYFAHVDPDGRGINILIHTAGYTLVKPFIENKAANYFESISAGVGDGKGIIDQLIIDEGTNPPGHRIHLLGMNDFWKGCSDVGIGIVECPGTTYLYYVSIIIAKHDF